MNGSVEQRFLFGTWEALHLMLAAERFASRGECFGVNQRYGKPAGRVFCALAAVVNLLASAWVHGIARIQAPVSAADDVDKMRQRRLRRQTSAKRQTWLRAMEGLETCCKSSAPSRRWPDCTHLRNQSLCLYGS